MKQEYLDALWLIAQAPQPLDAWFRRVENRNRLAGLFVGRAGEALDTLGESHQSGLIRAQPEACGADRQDVRARRSGLTASARCIFPTETMRDLRDRVAGAAKQWMTRTAAG
jgi:hypothetical protein